MNVLLVLAGSLGWAEEKAISGGEELSGKPEKEDRIYDIKLPQGFNPEPVDEAGIFKWKKDSGEIYLAVAELYAESAEEFFKALRKAAETNKRMEEVKALRLKGGKALLLKDKEPQDPARTRSWHLIAITRNKVISVDFSAPSKEFKSFVPAFEQTINSIKLKPSS